MKRVDNWDVKLVDFARSQIGREFVWGETDCVNTVRRALEIMYDEDVLADVIDATWTTRTGAARVFNRIGPFRDRMLEAGFFEIPKTVVRDGDILVSERESYDNVAMVMGSRVINCNERTGKIEVKNVDLNRDDVKAYRFNG